MDEVLITKIASRTAEAIDDTLTSVGLEHTDVQDQDMLARCQLMGLMMVLASRLVRMQISPDDAAKGLVETMQTVLATAGAEKP